MAEPVRPVDSRYADIATKLDADLRQAARPESLGGADITPREADWLSKGACAAVSYSQLALDKKLRLPEPEVSSICQQLVARAYARAKTKVAHADDRSVDRDIGDLLTSLRVGPDALYDINASAALQNVVGTIEHEALFPTTGASDLLAKADTLLVAIRSHRGNPVGDSIGAGWDKDLTRAQERLKKTLAAG